MFTERSENIWVVELASSSFVNGKEGLVCQKKHKIYCITCGGNRAFKNHRQNNKKR